MTGNYSARALFFALLCAAPLLLFSQIQGPEIKDSGLQLTLSASSFSSSLYVYGCGYGIADWHDVMQSDICAPAVWEVSSDSSGCMAGDTSLEGRILLVWEGACPVATKAKFAQEAGAIAMLIFGRANTQYAAVTGHNLGEEGELPAVQIPVFCIKLGDFQSIAPVFEQGDSVLACLKRPAVFLNSGRYAAWEIQQHCLLKPPTPFQFSVRLSNLSGMDLQNVTVRSRLLRSDGQELYNGVLLIPQIDSLVTDSLYLFPDVFDDFYIAPNLYKIVYEVQGKNNGAVYMDSRSIRFNTSTYFFAKELTGMQAAYRPDTLPQEDWGIGNVFYYNSGSFDYFKAYNAKIAILPGVEMGNSGEYYIELSLFRFNDDVLPDFSNFEPDGSSMMLVGVGFFTGDLSENASFFDVEIFDITTAETGVLLESGKYYALFAGFTGPDRYTYQGFSEEHVEGRIATLLHIDGTWRLVNFYGKPNPVIRMGLDAPSGFCLIGTEEPSRIDFKTFPNPAKDHLTIQLALQETSDVRITISDMTGRILITAHQKVFSEEQLTFPVSHLPNGAYSVRITTKEGSLTNKFIVQKE